MRLNWPNYKVGLEILPILLRHREDVEELTEVIKHTHGPVSFSINTNASASYSITIPNVEPGSSIVATTSKPLALGIIQYAHCTTAGLVEILFYNARNSTAPLTLNDFQIYITVIR